MTHCRARVSGGDAPYSTSLFRILLFGADLVFFTIHRMAYAKAAFALLVFAFYLQSDRFCVIYKARL